MLKQLLGGINLKNPRNWPLVARCVRGALSAGGGEPAPSLTQTTPPVLAD